MDAIIGKDIFIKDPSPELLAFANANLIIDNPEYISKEKMNLWTGNTPKTLQLFIRNGSSIILPVGCYEALKRFDIKYTLDFPKGHDFIPTNMSLYGYQQKAVEQMIGRHFGILKAPCGSGKTQMGLWLAGNGGKTLWLTHTKDLLNQSYDRACLYFDKSELGKITDGKVNIGERITFATVQTMVNLDLKAYEKEWNTIITDEVQHTAGGPAKMMMFYKVLSSLSASRKYGLSATVHRADGMIKSLFAIVGPVLAEVSDAEVADKTSEVRVIEATTKTKIDPSCLDTDGTLVYTKLITYLATNLDRNYHIAGNVALGYEAHSSLCLSDRLEQLAIIKDMLIASGVLEDQIRIINGKTKTSDRNSAIDDMRSGKAKILLASYGLAKEGLDIQNLDRVHFMTPQKDFAVVLQSAGRVARTAEGKTYGTVYDYVDEGIRYCKDAFRARVRHYKTKGYRIYENGNEVQISVRRGAKKAAT